MERTSPLGQDALAHAWPDSQLYAFPPIPLLLATLDRVQRTSHSLLLVASHWPGRPWFPSSTYGEYVDATTSLRKMDNLFVCYGGCRKGAALSKLSLSHWIVDVVLMQTEHRGSLCPWPLSATLPGVRLHHGLPQRFFFRTFAPWLHGPHYVCLRSSTELMSLLLILWRQLSCQRLRALN